MGLLLIANHQTERGTTIMSPYSLAQLTHHGNDASRKT